jgi:hypothetical protein
MIKKLLTVIATLTLSFSAKADLVNGGFEDFSVWGYGFYSGSSPTVNWATTAPDNTLEIWENGFLGVPAYEGNSFAELNANYASTLYQDVNGLGDNNQINWKFAHRGRDGTDTMRLTITDLGADQIYGGGDDTVLFQGEFTDSNTAWGLHVGTVTSIGNLTRFAFESVNAVGGNTQGNFIDDCGFGANVVIPGPSVLALGALFLMPSNRRRRS